MKTGFREVVADAARLLGRSKTREVAPVQLHQGGSLLGSDAPSVILAYTYESYPLLAILTVTIAGVTITGRRFGVKW